eukprot:SAG31_NODE_19252_length_608_cov_0.952849_1_plen_122_part_10
MEAQPTVPNYNLEAAAKEWAREVAARHDVVVFDMDQCAVGQHSRGRLPKAELRNFASKATPDFVAAVRALAVMGTVGLAMATHSDLAEHSPDRPRCGKQCTDSAIQFGFVAAMLVRVSSIV